MIEIAKKIKIYQLDIFGKKKLIGEIKQGGNSKNENENKKNTYGKLQRSKNPCDEFQ